MTDVLPAALWLPVCPCCVCPQLSADSGAQAGCQLLGLDPVLHAAFTTITHLLVLLLKAAPFPVILPLTDSLSAEENGSQCKSHGVANILLKNLLYDAAT